MRFAAFLIAAFVLASGSRASPDTTKVITDEELAPLLNELQGRLQQVRKRELPMEKLTEHYGQAAAAPGTPRQRAIHAYVHGWILQLLPNREGDARREFERSVKLWDPFPAAHVGVAVLAARMKDFAAAKTRLRRALAIDSNYAKAYIWQARIAEQEGDLAGAEGLFKKSLDRDPTNEALVGLALVHVKQFRNSYDDESRATHKGGAISAANAWVVMEPENPRAYILRARVYYDLNELHKAVDTLEDAYSNSGLKDEQRLKFLLGLYEFYLMRADMKGVDSTLKRALMHKSLAADQRKFYEGKRADIAKMKDAAPVVWQVDALLGVLKNDGMSIDRRVDALRSLLMFWQDDQVLADPNLRQLSGRVFKATLRVLVQAPPRLTVEMMRFFRNTMRDPRLIRILVHFIYPNGKTDTVRAETVRTIAACCGPAALPALFYCLRDDSGAVLRDVDKSLSEQCERRAAIGVSIQALDAEQRKRARLIWRDYTHTAEGAERLAAGFAALGKITENEPTTTRTLRSAPMVDHAVAVLLDNDIPWKGWKAAYEFLTRYWGKTFRPLERRELPVEEFERVHVVKALDEFWKKADAADTPAPEAPKEDGDEDKEKRD